ncbi:amidohydrolase family protein [Rhizobium sp. P32RR-XVIII]|uniref:amidohydrolase family protein n=1 Tax=Rhizobium sp. P32RR-XVIII TaxID=2726738 RepID=UPI00183EA589|nr:amidohydrolase family protein [Rhizobium sp. P32RR-XVIII]NLS07768.1 amidohydrolase family protein [Rhizobium sp. P32RR-XVIII]
MACTERQGYVGDFIAVGARDTRRRSVARYAASRTESRFCYGDPQWHHSGFRFRVQQLKDQARGIAVADGSTSIEDLASMKEAGIRGLRFVETRLADQSRIPGTIPLEQLFERLALKLAQLDMHAEIWAPLATVLSQWSRIEACRIPIVLDHMGAFDVSLGVEHRDFQRLLDLVSDGKVWIKLAVCRRQFGDASFAKVRPFHDAFIMAEDRRLVWASDFPFVRYPAWQPEMKDLLGLFRSWINDRGIEQRILVENPTTLYWCS